MYVRILTTVALVYFAASGGVSGQEVDALLDSILRRPDSSIMTSISDARFCVSARLLAGGPRFSASLCEDDERVVTLAATVTSADLLQIVGDNLASGQPVDAHLVESHSCHLARTSGEDPRLRRLFDEFAGLKTALFPKRGATVHAATLRIWAGDRSDTSFEVELRPPVPYRSLSALEQWAVALGKYLEETMQGSCGTVRR